MKFIEKEDEEKSERRFRIVGEKIKYSRRELLGIVGEKIKNSRREDYE